ncbi:MAG: prepilin-type N-terminal cleavage/methylation domain-containing protein [bacterium]|nr:prepilin-type N-terminal cleavage/methylation domain-containing protein [bacterium]
MKKQSGFTLIELLVVIAIIGLLSTLAVVALNNARAKSRDAKRVSDIKQVQTALELYYNDKNGYPATLAACTTGLGTAGCVNLSDSAAGWGGTAGTVVYMGQVPANPAPNGAAYVYTQTGSGASYTITFSLEGSVAGLASGVHTAGQSGIQ